MLSRIVKVKLPPDVKGRRLLDYLAARFTYHTREQWLELLHEGRVTLDNVPARPDSPLAWNQMMEYNPRPRPEPEVPRNVRLIYADDSWIALDKPAGLPCHPAGGFFYNTLWAILKEGQVPQLEPLDGIHFVSRIDRETSGIVLLARTPRTHTRAMKRLLHAPETVKTYWVVVEGDFPDEMQADGWLYHDPGAAVDKRRSFAFRRPDGLPAETSITHLRCLRRANGLSLVEAVLGTGRFHQIRATMQSLGFPVLGDKIYGRDETIYLRFVSRALTPSDQEALRIPRQALHAVRLSFDGHLWEAPPPADWPLFPR